MAVLKRIFSLGLVIPKFLFLVGIFLRNNLMRMVAPGVMLKKVKEQAKLRGKASMEIKSLDDVGFMFSWDLVKNQTRNAVIDIFKAAQLGQEAPDPQLHELSSGNLVSLLGFAKTGRPLVLNFGSCTWPPFMASLGEFANLKEKFSHSADFVTIYIAEAHPAERGHFRDNFDISTHQDMKERVAAAGTLRDEAGDKLSNCPILVDPMDNRAQLAYASIPERLYVVLDGKIVFVGGLGPHHYDIKAVDSFLAALWDLGRQLFFNV